MGDFIIKTGDLLKVTIPPPAIVPMLEAPVPLEGSGETVTVNDTPVCLRGDELPDILMEPLPYTLRRRSSSRAPASSRSRYCRIT